MISSFPDQPPVEIEIRRTRRPEVSSSETVSSRQPQLGSSGHQCPAARTRAKKSAGSPDSVARISARAARVGYSGTGEIRRTDEDLRANVREVEALRVGERI